MHKLGPVQPSAAYEMVVENLRRALLLGRFLPGEKLPAERELALQLQVSRTTLREALRVLEGEKLIETKRGATGGIVVKAPSLSRSEFVDFVSRRIRELEQLYEYREAIECATISLAAVKRTDEDLARLADAVEQMNLIVASGPDEDQAMVVARFLAADAHFHEVLAKASGNDHLVQAVEDIRATKFLPVGAVFTEINHAANAGHSDLLAAVRDRDAVRAADLMRDHIRGTLRGIRELVGLPAGGDVAVPKGGRRKPVSR